MSQHICSYCDIIFKINRDLDRHVMTCRIKLSTQRRKIFKSAVTTMKKTFVHDTRENIVIIDVQDQHVIFLDHHDDSQFKNKNCTIAFDVSNENEFVIENLNKDTYDLFNLQCELSIYFVTFALKVRIYEDEIDRRAKSYLASDADHAFSHVRQIRNDSD